MRPARLLLAQALALTLAPAVSRAAEPVVVKLWPGKAPGEVKEIGPERYIESKKGQLDVKRLTDVSEPTVAVYAPPTGKANGTAAIVAPGGGYNILAIQHEGTDVCKWLNDLGVTAVLLKYRVPGRPALPGQQIDNPAPLQDAQRAVSVVRARAAEWGIDPDRIGVLGFSAGGHLAARTALYDRRTYDPVDDADKASHRPNFAVLVYPAYLTEKGGGLKPEFAATKDAPPTFFAHASNDPVTSEGSALLYLSLKKAGVPAEMHLYATGGHGFGMNKIPHPAATWPDRCGEWMQARGLLRAK